jgi:hypothetical protein
MTSVLGFVAYVQLISGTGTIGSVGIRSSATRSQPGCSASIRNEVFRPGENSTFTR